MALPSGGAQFHRLGHVKTLDYAPSQPRRFDLCLSPHDLLDRPHSTGGNFVQRGDNALRAGFPRVSQRHSVIRPKPAPCLLHLQPPPTNTSSLRTTTTAPVS